MNDPDVGVAAGDEYVLRLSGVCKKFADIQAVRDLNLEVAHGEIVSLVGPSGCGKTTTLRLVAGFEKLDTGTIELSGHLGGEDGAPGVGLVFQDGALFPHLDVTGNAGFGLHKLPKPERADRIREVLEMVGLAGMGNRKPHELSGGEQQRVALARALAPRPALMLLDEPLSHLDPHLAGRLGDEILEIIRSSGAAAIWVTHDQQEGLSVADRVALMEAGTIRQLGPPAELWRRPADAWVAEFLGYGDVINGEVHDGNLRTALGEVRVTGMADGQTAKALVRPEDVSMADGGCPGTIVRSFFSGSDDVYYIRLENGERVRCRQPAGAEYSKGDTVRVWLVSESLPTFLE